MDKWNDILKGGLDGAVACKGHFALEFVRDNGNLIKCAATARGIVNLQVCWLEVLSNEVNHLIIAVLAFIWGGLGKVTAGNGCW